MRGSDVPAQAAPEKLDALTTLRFFAASMIVFQHSMGFLGISDAVAWHLPLHQGVSFFFVLSGFILAFVYRDGWGPATRRRFFVARFARIYPVHLLGFLLVLVLLPRGAWTLNGHPTVATTVANLLAIQSWFPFWNFFASFNSPSWSISAEFLFYLAFPLLIAVRPRVAIVSTLLVALALVALVAWSGMPYGKAGEPGMLASGLLYNHPVPRLFEFALGIGLHALWRRWRDQPTSTGIATGIELGALCLVVASVWYSPPLIATLLASLPESWRMPVGTYLGGTASALPFAALILAMAFERGLVSRALRRPFMVRLGEISFAMYMIHGTLLIFYDIHKGAFATYPLWLRYGAFWALLLAGASAVWFHVEVPWRRRILRTFDRSTARTPHGPPLPDAPIRAHRAGRGMGLKAVTQLFALYLGCVAVGYAITHPPSQLRLLNATDREARSGKEDRVDARFGDRITLVGSRLLDVGTAHPRLELHWRAERDQKLDQTIAVHLLDPASAIAGQDDYPQDVAAGSVRAGDEWVDTRPITAVPASARTLGIALFKGDEFLRTASGHTDWDGRRLLLPLYPPASTTSPTP